MLVWQDFQFACGVYPAYDSFVQSVKAEAEDNVKRLRHHPSIAIFCGNNEGMRLSSWVVLLNIHAWLDYQMVLQWGGTRVIHVHFHYPPMFISLL